MPHVQHGTGRIRSGIFPSLLFLFLSSLLACESSPVVPVDDGQIVIQYSVQDPAHVKFWVENSFDTSMGTFVNTVQPAGNYAVVLLTDGWPEGIYLSIVEKTPVSGSGVIRSEGTFYVFQ